MTIESLKSQISEELAGLASAEPNPHQTTGETP